jgi:hypothetical protein
VVSRESGTEMVDRKNITSRIGGKNMLEEAKLEKILLNNICSEITEEVMDLGGDLSCLPKTGLAKS